MTSSYRAVARKPLDSATVKGPLVWAREQEARVVQVRHDKIQPLRMTISALVLCSIRFRDHPEPQASAFAAVRTTKTARTRPSPQSHNL